MILNDRHYREIVAHALQARPNECCGLVAKKAECSVQVFPMRNIEPTPQGFVMDSEELYKVLQDMGDLDLELGAIYHSHLDAPPKPSQTDIGFAAGWPGVDWVIAGVEGSTVEVCSWVIIKGRPYQVGMPT